MAILLCSVPLVYPTHEQDGTSIHQNYVAAIYIITQTDAFASRPWIMQQGFITLPLTPLLYEYRKRCSFLISMTAPLFISNVHKIKSSLENLSFKPYWRSRWKPCIVMSRSLSVSLECSNI